MQDSHYTSALDHAHRAADDLESITDPGQRASVNATLALVHALLSTGEDMRGMTQQMFELSEAVR
ncbi:hypothetical protein CUT44_14055 [Streptomyces carminius]|uniref:Uncharacterized protein n=1 Tax=Streptomyces carminius TaxID=2665496 RepID=A0A2M8LYQ0_9ACTN|nr:hypothetical protein [Streptomyces carminius]PJE97103.1 hypothetical protein CUT44_14055 [Streptomyces carminius]